MRINIINMYDMTQKFIIKIQYCLFKYKENIINVVGILFQTDVLTVDSLDEEIEKLLQEMVFVTTTTTEKNNTLTETELEIIVNSLDTVANLTNGGNVTVGITNVSLRYVFCLTHTFVQIKSTLNMWQT